jgi:hypothetical protein
MDYMNYNYYNDYYYYVFKFIKILTMNTISVKSFVHKSFEEYVNCFYLLINNRIFFRKAILTGEYVAIIIYLRPN